MKIRLFYFLFGMLFYTLQVHAADPVEFRELCKYDSNCHKIRANGRWTMPPLPVLKRLCVRQDLVDQASKMYQVSPEVINSCLLAEHTLLVGPLDHLVDLAARYGRGLGRNPSLGLVQMRLSVARKVHSAIFHQKVSDQQLVENLLNDKKALVYMAALLNIYREVYRRASLDTSIGTLCSLYLVGGAKARAEKHRKNGTQAKTNFYGFFARLHRPLMNELLHSDCSSVSLQTILRSHYQALNGERNFVSTIP